MNARWIHIWLFLLLLSFAPITDAQENVRIGVVGPLQGESKYGGVAHKQGLLLAIDELNQNHTVKYRIVPIFRDDKGLPAESQQMVKDLIQNQKVLAIMGACNSACSLVDAAVAQKFETVFFTT